MNVSRGSRVELRWTDTGDEIIVHSIRALDGAERGGLRGAADDARFPPNRRYRCQAVLNPQVQAVLERRGWRRDGLDYVKDPT